MLWKHNSSISLDRFAINDDVQCQFSDIFKLDIKCFKKLLDYLGKKDLIAIGGTCKYLARIAGYCFQQNYSAVDIDCGYRSIFINYYDSIHFFNQSIRKVRVCIDDFDSFRYIERFCHKLKEIEFFNIKITKSKMECIKETLSRIEVLRIECCKIEGNFHETVLVFCKHLKHLRVIGFPYSTVIAGIDNDWLMQKYPTLIHLELLRFRSNESKELITFLEINPNIQKYAIPVNYIWLNRESILKANIKLDHLITLIYFVSKKKFISICNLLNQLHDIGIFKKLDLYHISKFEQSFVMHLSSLKALVKLRIPPTKCVELSALQHLEEIRIHRSSQLKGLTALPIHLSNLKRIHFSSATLADVVILVSQAESLGKIQIEQFEDGLNWNKIIDLIALNNEREKLQAAENLTIYVREDIYLATKWAYIETKLSLIELKRTDAYNWDHAFCFNLF